MPDIIVPNGKTALGWFDYASRRSTDRYYVYDLVETFTVNSDYSFVAVGYSTNAALKLPKALTRIEEEAFVDSDAEIVFVPAKCRSIASGAFSDCGNLDYVVFESNTTTYAETAFPIGTVLIFP